MVYSSTRFIFVDETLSLSLTDLVDEPSRALCSKEMVRHLTVRYMIKRYLMSNGRR